MSDMLHPDELPAGDKTFRIQVEVISSADVKRLEDRDEDLRKEIKQLRAENEGLRRSFYELLEVFGDIRHSHSQSKK